MSKKSEYTPADDKIKSQYNCDERINGLKSAVATMIFIATTFDNPSSNNNDLDTISTDCTLIATRGNSNQKKEFYLILLHALEAFDQIVTELETAQETKNRFLAFSRLFKQSCPNEAKEVEDRQIAAAAAKEEEKKVEPSTVTRNL